MRKLLLSIMVLLSAVNLSAQINSSTFEDVELPLSGYYNGSDFAGGFKSGKAFFTNMYDTTWGPYWEGFAASNVKNDTDGTYNNQYASITKGGRESNNYAVCYSKGIIRLDSASKHDPVYGLYITNTTYAYFDMKNGSTFSKKFGGASGHDSDYFRVVFEGWKDGVKRDTAVKAYLADYRFSNDSLDFIIKHWQYVPLYELGLVDSISISFESTDTGSFGINTPTYVCIDIFNTLYTGLSQVKKSEPIEVYPNPARDMVYVRTATATPALTLYDLQGKLMMEVKGSELSLNNIAPGMYLLNIETPTGVTIKRIIVE